jgi:PncC family amidohydrolase
MEELEDQQHAVAKACAKLFTLQNLTVSVAESCTGGMLSSVLTDIPGSSDYYKMGMVVYSNQAKIQFVGVNHEIIHQHGAISKETAYELAIGIKKLANTNIGIGVTGIAGPTGGSLEKPIGTVYIGVIFDEEAKINKYVFSGDRAQNKREFTLAALKMVLEMLRSKSYFKLEIA